jgi:hypothetical protein
VCCSFDARWALSPLAPLASASSGVSDLDAPSQHGTPAHGAQPAPRFAYRRSRGATAKLMALTLRLSDVRLFRLLPGAGSAAGSSGASRVALAPPLDTKCVASSAYAEIMGMGLHSGVSTGYVASPSGTRGSGKGAALARTHSVLAGVAEAAGWDDMGRIGTIELMQAPVLPSSGDDRKQPMFVMAEDARIVLTESTRCVPRCLRCLCALRQSHLQISG